MDVSITSPVSYLVTGATMCKVMDTAETGQVTPGLRQGASQRRRIPR
jgi:hypothetical protein